MTYYRDFVLKIFDIEGLPNIQQAQVKSSDGIQKSCSTSDVISKKDFQDKGFKSEAALVTAVKAAQKSGVVKSNLNDVILKSASNGDVTSIDSQRKKGRQKSLDASNRTADGILKPCSSHDDLGSGNSVITESLLSKLEAVLARLVSDYRAIFAIEEEAFCAR